MGHVQKLVEGALKFGVDPARKTTLLLPTQIAKEILILSKMIVIQKVVVSKGRLFYIFHCIRTKVILTSEQKAQSLAKVLKSN